MMKGKGAMQSVLLWDEVIAKWIKTLKDAGN